MKQKLKKFIIELTIGLLVLSILFAMTCGLFYLCLYFGFELFPIVWTILLIFSGWRLGKWIYEEVKKDVGN